MGLRYDVLPSEDPPPPACVSSPAWLIPAAPPPLGWWTPGPSHTPPVSGPAEHGPSSGRYPFHAENTHSVNTRETQGKQTH